MHPRQSYVLFSVLFSISLSFMMTSYAPYLMSIGLLPSEVSLVNVGFFGAILICELPTGIFADRVGRIWSVRLGISIIICGMSLYATVTGFMTALLAEILIGIGAAFISGALSAWIKDALHLRGEEAAYGQTVARAAQLQSLGTLLGGVVGGLIGLWNFRATWIACAIIASVACFVTFRCMREERSVETISPHVRRQHPLRTSWAVMRGKTGLLWTVIASMSFGLVLPFNHYWAPYFTSLFGEVVRTFLWVPMCLSLALGAYIVRRMGLGKGREIYGIPFSLALTGAGLSLMASGGTSGWPITCLVLHEVGRGAFQPSLEVFVQSRVESAYRATYGSLQSFLTRLAYVGILSIVTFWAYGHEWDNGFTGLVWSVSGGVLCIIALLLYMRRPKTAGLTAPPSPHNGSLF